MFAPRASTLRPPAHAVVFFDPNTGNRRAGPSAIPFSRPGPAESLAKRATNEGRPAIAVEVFQDHETGDLYDRSGHRVVIREEKKRHA